MATPNAAPEIMLPRYPRRFTMYRNKVQDVGMKAQNHEAELLGIHGGKDSAGAVLLAVHGRDHLLGVDGGSDLFVDLHRNRLRHTLSS